jgi:hypothetical protein
MELQNRERKVDITKLDNDQLDILSAQIGEKVRAICDEAAGKVNAILKIYGASAKIAIAFDGLPEKKEKKPRVSTKKTNKTAQANLK